MKISLITGANKGIGKEICRQLLAKDFFVIISGRNSAMIRDVQKELDPEQKKSLALPLDVSNDESISIAVERISAMYGSIDVLVNNAGLLGNTSGLLKMTEAEFHEIFSTNALGTMKMIRAFAPLLAKAKKSRIINVSTGMSVMEGLTSSHAPYRLSKVMVNALTMIAASELESKGIEVFAVDPGWVRTDMGGPSAPLTVKEGADTIVWLATEQVGVSGGFYCRRKRISY